MICSLCHSEVFPPILSSRAVASIDHTKRVNTSFSATKRHINTPQSHSSPLVRFLKRSNVGMPRQPHYALGHDFSHDAFPNSLSHMFDKCLRTRVLARNSYDSVSSMPTKSSWLQDNFCAWIRDDFVKRRLHHLDCVIPSQRSGVIQGQKEACSCRSMVIR